MTTFEVAYEHAKCDLKRSGLHSEKCLLRRTSGLRFPWGVEGYLSPEEGVFLYRCAKSLPNNSFIVELGCYKGRSTICMAQSGHHVMSVDHFKGEALLPSVKGIVHPDHIKGTYRDEFQANLAKWDVEEKVIVWPGDTVEAAASFDPTKPTVDLLFIDSDHSYEHVLAEWQAWEPLLEPDAVVVFDDYMWEGPQRVIHEVLLPGGWECIGAVGKDAAYRKGTP